MRVCEISQLPFSTVAVGACHTEIIQDTMTASIESALCPVPDNLGSFAGRPLEAAEWAGTARLPLRCLSMRGGPVSGCCWAERVLWEMGPRGAGREGDNRVGFSESGTEGVRWLKAVKRSASA